MENKRPQVDSGCRSGSSISSQLFGSPASSSSNDIFASIFPPKGVRRNSSSCEVRRSRQKEHSGSRNRPWNTKQDYNAYKHGGASHANSGNKDQKNSIFQQEEADPCNMSSSFYYGGQDIYSKSPTHSTSSSHPMYKKDGGEDDPSGASRGNWWEGSLYY